MARDMWLCITLTRVLANYYGNLTNLEGEGEGEGGGGGGRAWAAWGGNHPITDTYLHTLYLDTVKTSVTG